MSARPQGRPGAAGWWRCARGHGTPRSVRDGLAVGRARSVRRWYTEYRCPRTFLVTGLLPTVEARGWASPARPEEQDAAHSAEVQATAQNRRIHPSLHMKTTLRSETHRIVLAGETEHLCLVLE